ncbi:ABC transporter substrate-binding protein [Halorarum salinum]|nr:extracellular solute-binding protein [Halobaculum salinum]
MNSDSNGRGTSPRASRRTFIKVAGASGIAGLSGCSGGGDESDDGNGAATGTNGSDISGQEVHLLSQENSEPFQEYWESLAADFEDETGASVRIEYIGETGSAQERIIQLLQSNDPPEVAQVVVPNAATFGSQGVLADHSEVINTLEERYGALPEQFLFEFDGDNTFVPNHQTIHSQWYREDVFDEVPNTWEKELAMAREHDDGQGGTRGAFLSNASELGEPTFSLFTRGWGNDAVVCQRDDNDNVQVVMDEEPYRSRWIEVFEHVQELAQYSPDNTGVDYTDLFDAMEQELTYQLYIYGSRGKDTDSNDFVENIRNTTAPVPEEKYEEGGRRSWANTTGYLTFRGSNEQAGQEFLKFWTRPENYYEFFTITPVHLLPTQPQILEDSEFQDQLQEALGPQWDYERDVVDLVEMANTSFDIPLETNPPNPYAGPIFSSFELGKIQRDILIDGRNIEEAIDARAQNMQGIIDETQI